MTVEFMCWTVLRMWTFRLRMMPWSRGWMAAVLGGKSMETPVNGWPVQLSNNSRTSRRYRCISLLNALSPWLNRFLVIFAFELIWNAYFEYLKQGQSLLSPFTSIGLLSVPVIFIATRAVMRSFDCLQHCRI